MGVPSIANSPGRGGHAHWDIHISYVRTSFGNPSPSGEWFWIQSRDNAIDRSVPEWGPPPPPAPGENQSTHIILSSCSSTAFAWEKAPWMSWGHHCIHTKFYSVRVPNGRSYNFHRSRQLITRIMGRLLPLIHPSPRTWRRRTNSVSIKPILMSKQVN